MAHRLDSLFEPASLAILGASQREGSVGKLALDNCLEGQFEGALYAINPGYQEISGVRCFPGLSALPEPVEHVIFALSDERLEAALDEAIAHGIKSCTIFSSLVLSEDTSPALKDRIESKLLAAGILACGANCMGFYNFGRGLWASGFDTRHHRKQGNVSLISQSGAGMCSLLDSDERLDFNYAVSSGQELTVSMEDYLDYFIEQPSTRVVGMFMETSRRPEKFIPVLEKARQKGIPIVVVKVGRTDLAAEMAISHSGALAGSDATYNAIFERYGVMRVDDMDQLATALIMFAQPHATGRGGVVSLHDSGGERQLTIDLADQFQVPMAQLSEASVAELETLLDPGLPAINPLDAWGAGGADSKTQMQNCFSTLLKDPEAALGAVIHARAPSGKIYPDYIDYLRAGQKASGKPVFLVSARQGTGADDLVLEAGREGLPVIDGISQFLVGARCLLAHRDFLQRAQFESPVLDAQRVGHWKKKLSQVDTLNEWESAQFLSGFGIPMMASAIVDSEASLLQEMQSMNYPVVLKTAVPGIEHKSEVAGVCLNLGSEEELLAAYRDLAKRLGQQAMLAPMQTESGVEMILGVAHDEQFGAMVVMGMGGIYTEILGDAVIAVPPFDQKQARSYVDQLKMRALLDGARGGAAMQVEAYCDAAAKLSAVAVAFAQQIKEIDINPLKLTANGCVGLDALIVKRD